MFPLSVNGLSINTEGRFITLSHNERELSNYTATDFIAAPYPDSEFGHLSHILKNIKLVIGFECRATMCVKDIHDYRTLSTEEFFEAPVASYPRVLAGQCLFNQSCKAQQYAERSKIRQVDHPRIDLASYHQSFKSDECRNIYHIQCGTIMA